MRRSTDGLPGPVRQSAEAHGHEVLLRWTGLAPNKLHHIAVVDRTARQSPIDHRGLARRGRQQAVWTFAGVTPRLYQTCAKHIYESVDTESHQRTGGSDLQACSPDVWRIRLSLWLPAHRCGACGQRDTQPTSLMRNAAVPDNRCTWRATLKTARSTTARPRDRPIERVAHPCNSRTLRQFRGSLVHERTAAFSRPSRSRWVRPAT